jgi:hypothetical protein
MKDDNGCQFLRVSVGSPLDTPLAYLAMAAQPRSDCPYAKKRQNVGGMYFFVVFLDPNLFGVQWDIRTLSRPNPKIFRSSRDIDY